MRVAEEWRAVGRDPRYEISSLGRVRRIAGGMGAVRGRVLSPAYDRGYPVVSVPPDSRRVAYVHVLVAEAFCGPRPPGMDALHRNGNPPDVQASNIYWGSPKRNAEDRAAHGRTARGERHGAAKIDEATACAIRSYALANSITETSRRFGISRSQVHRIKVGASWRQAI